jgi:hypothetical protein
VATTVTEYPGPEPRIERVGRWTYRVWIADGICSYGPDGYGWLVLGQRRAHRKVVRVLRRYLRDKARCSAVDNPVDSQYGRIG